MTKSNRRTYKCGKCGDNGHNARTCTGQSTVAVITAPTKTAPTESTPITEEEVATSETESDDSEEPAKPVLMPMGETQDLTSTRRGPSGRPDAASPYTCPACQEIAVLLLVEYMAGGTGLRCTECRNSTPIKTILKWGARPGDKA